MSRRQSMEEAMYGMGPIVSIEFGLLDAHLLGKVLDEMDDAAMQDAGFSEQERQVAEWVFEDLDAFLNDAIGEDWNKVEVGEDPSSVTIQEFVIE